MDDELRIAVRLAMGQTEACAAVREIYVRLQTEIDQRKPICLASGKCCHFEAYEHRLYVTTLELAAFMNDFSVNQSITPVPSPGTPDFGELSRTGEGGEGYFELRTTSATSNHPYLKPLPVYREREPGRCPLQVDKLCGVHSIRPFGCRIFFCDPTATQWQQEQYELFHTELKGLHERFGVPYHYVEWRYALGELHPSRL